MTGTTIACPHCGQWTELVAPEAPAKKSNRAGLFIACGVVLFLLAAVAVGSRYRKPGDKTPAANLVQKPADKPAPAKTNPVAVAPSPAPPPEPKPDKSRPKDPADLKQLGEVKLEKTMGNSLVYATGTVTNDSGWQRFSVKVELDMINVKGRIIGKTQDQKAIIEPHQAWQFRALIPDPQAVAAKVSSLTEEK